MDKSTTKVRIVFDCAAKCNGTFLSDTSHSGPKLLQDLFNVFVRFFRNLVSIACELKEMYLQIEMRIRTDPTSDCYGEIITLIEGQTYSSLSV